MKNSKGTILILVLWAMIVFGAIALGLSYRAAREVKMVHLTLDRANAYFLSWNGLQEIIDILNNDDTSVDSWKDEWNRSDIGEETEKGRWDVADIYDEERYIDINIDTNNNVDVGVLEAIFGDYPVLFNSILDWLDKDNTTRLDPDTGDLLGAEDQFYLKNFGYESRDGPMKSLFELGMIREGQWIFQTSNDNVSIQKEKFGIPLAYACHPGGGFPPPLPDLPGPQQPIQPVEPSPRGTGITVYGDGKININTAPYTVLRALGFAWETIKRMYWFRQSGGIFIDTDGNNIIDSNDIIQRLVNSGWLRPSPPYYPPDPVDQFVLNDIKKVVDIQNIKNKIKVNSSYFRIRIISTTKRGAKHTLIAVLNRFKDTDGKTKCKIVSWWELIWL